MLKLLLRNKYNKARYSKRINLYFADKLEKWKLLKTDHNNAISKSFYKAPAITIK